MICVTKDTLRQLNAAIGKLDKDSGQVVVGFIGRLEKTDGLYHGEIHYRDADEDPPKDTVSVKDLISSKTSACSKLSTTPSSTKATSLPPLTKQTKRSEKNGNT